MGLFIWRYINCSIWRYINCSIIVYNYCSLLLIVYYIMEFILDCNMWIYIGGISVFMGCMYHILGYVCIMVGCI